MSSVGYGPLWPVNGPPPLSPVYGLLQAAVGPSVRVDPPGDLLGDGGVPRWQNGVEVYPYPPDVTSGWNTCAAGSDQDEKEFGSELDRPIFSSFTLYLPETCPTLSVPDQQAFRARAIAAFAAVEGHGVERELLTGAIIPNNPHLADGAGDFPAGDAATPIAEAVALLENAIAASGRQGLIHMSPGAAVAACRQFDISRDDRLGLVRTINGTVVIPGYGYALGDTPEGHAAPGAGQEWIYATGPVDVRRSEVFVVPDTVAEAVDRGTGGATNGRPNSITYRAERQYVVTWDTAVQAAVLADRCTDC